MSSIRIFAAISVLSICIGCTNEPIETKPIETKPSITVLELVESFDEASLDSESDVRHVLENAANSDRAVLYLSFDWSLNSKFHAPRYAEFVIGYDQQHPDDNVLFHFVDCTSITSDYSPLTELDGWNEAMSGSGSGALAGGGAVVWLKQGRVVNIQDMYDFQSTEAIITLTELLLPKNDG